MKKAGYIAPAFEEVDERNEGEESEKDPPSDRPKEFLELFPAGEVGIGDDLPGG